MKFILNTKISTTTELSIPASTSPDPCTHNRLLRSAVLLQCGASILNRLFVHCVLRPSKTFIFLRALIVRKLVWYYKSVCITAYHTARHSLHSEPQDRNPSTIFRSSQAYGAPQKGLCTALFLKSLNELPMLLTPLAALTSCF